MFACACHFFVIDFGLIVTNIRWRLLPIGSNDTVRYSFDLCVIVAWYIATSCTARLTIALFCRRLTPRRSRVFYFIASFSNSLHDSFSSFHNFHIPFIPICNTARRLHVVCVSMRPLSSCFKRRTCRLRILSFIIRFTPVIILFIIIIIFVLFIFFVFISFIPLTPF
uniref:Uncharacterized protein n=1 Tax=Cacopsylla melanoneura TaxID=428564 RepID=A0A8D8PSL4_9HEMI